MYSCTRLELHWRLGWDGPNYCRDNSDKDFLKGPVQLRRSYRTSNDKSGKQGTTGVEWGALGFSNDTRRLSPIAGQIILGHTVSSFIVLVIGVGAIFKVGGGAGGNQFNSSERPKWRQKVGGGAGPCYAWAPPDFKVGGGALAPFSYAHVGARGFCSEMSLLKLELFKTTVKKGDSGVFIVLFMGVGAGGGVDLPPL